MAKDPAVLFYTSDFISGTVTMTNEQRGKYIMLLCIQHQKGKLTQKDLEAYLDDDDFEILEKFPISEDGFYYNIRMKEEAKKRKSYSESRRNNRTGKSKTNDNDMNNLSESYKKHMINTSSTYEKHMENENVNVNENKTVNKTVNKTGNKSTRRIIQKALDTLIEYELPKEKYDEAAYNINEIGGLKEAYKLLSIKTGENWTERILQNSLMYKFNITE